MKWLVRLIGILSVVLVGVIAPLQTMAQSVSLTATPNTIGLQESVTLTAGGLTANQTYVLEVTFEDGSSVFLTERTSNNSGQLVLTLTSEATDPPGVYTVTLSDSSGEIARTDFILANGGGSSSEGNADSTSNVTVIPDTATVGNSHNILISGLENNETVTLQIRYMADDTLKYTRRLDADDNGRIQLEIFTEENEDLPGEYRIIVINGNSETVGSATLTLTDFIGRNGVMEVTPLAGDAGSTHTIRTTDLKPFADLTITVTEVATNNRVFLTRQRADVDGVILLEYTSEADATAGEYRVEVLEDEVIVASGSLMVGEASVVPMQTTSVMVMPSSGAIGTAHTIIVNGLAPASDFTLDVIFDATNTSVYSTDRTADASGNFEFVIQSEDGDEIGDYRVEIAQDGALIGSTTFVILGGDSADSDANSPVGRAVITPEVADAGQSHIITASGLDANTAVVVQLVAGDGTTITERTATSDTNGSIALSVATEATTMAGEYTVNVVADGVVVATTSFTVRGDVVAQPMGDITVSITPPAGVRGTEHVITVDGLNADEVITMDIQLGGESLFSTELIADADGMATTVIFSEESDASGDYDIVITRDGDVVAEGILTIEDAVADGGDSAEEGDTLPDVEAFEGTISVNPPSAERGTTHVITVDGLNANETVVFQVILGEAVLYETERTADAEGAFDIEIRSDPTDAFGVYQVAILREGMIVGQEDLTVARPVATNNGDDTNDTGTNDTGAEASDVVSAEGNTVFDGSLNGDRPEATYDIEGQTGDVFYITLTSNEFDSYLKLMDSNGFVVAENDDGAGNLNSLIGPLVLTYDDTYTVVVSSYDYSTSGTVEPGNYTLSINSGDLSSLAYDAPQSVSFDATSGLQFYSIDAEVGDIIDVEVVGDGIDTVLRLIDPFNSEVAFDDDSGAGVDPEINRYIVTTEGTYIVSLAPFNTGAAGDVTVTVSRRGALSLDDGAQVVQLNSKVNREVLVLEGNAGDAFQLRVNELGSDTNELYITVTQDTYTVMNYSTSWGIPDEMMLGFVLPADGSVSIIIESYDHARLEIEAIPAE